MAIAELGYRVDTSGLVRGEKALNSQAVAAGRADAAADKLAGGMSRANKTSAAYGAQMKSATGQTANLTSQLNDIGVMLAAGQNPLQLALQQGTQINQVFAQMGGGVGAVRSIGAAFMSMINPLSLATIGIIAGGAALVQWGMSAFGASDDTYALKEAIGDLSDETRDARDELRLLETGLQSLAQLRIQDEIAGINKELERYSDVISNAPMQVAQNAEIQQRAAQKELESLQKQLDAAIAANDALEARKQLLEDIETLGNAAELTAEYQSQAELSNAIAQYGAESAEVEAIKRDHAMQAAEAYIQQNNLSGAVAQSVRDAAMAAYDADVNAANAAQSLRDGEAAARGLASALASAAGFSASLDSTVAGLQAEIAALESGADAAVASQAAIMRAKAESMHQDMIAKGVSQELADIALLGQEAQIQKIEQLTLAKKDMVAADRAGSKSTKKAMSEAEKAIKEVEDAAKKYADTMKGYVVDGIMDAWDWMVDGFKGGMGSIWDIFTNTIKQMIAYAVRNRIMVSLGLGVTGGGIGGVAGAAASAAGGGGGLLGMLGGGAGGLLGGLGATISGIWSGVSGIFTGGGLSASFANLGGLISGSVSGLGAIGAALPAIGIIAAGLSLIFGSTKKIDEGIRITVGSMDALEGAVGGVNGVFGNMTSALTGITKLPGIEGIFGGSARLTADMITETIDGFGVSVETYVKTQTKRLGGLMKSTKTKYSAAAEDVVNPIANAIGEIQTGIIDAAAYLGISDDVFAGFFKKLKVSFKKMDEDEKMEALQEALTELGDEFALMIPGLEELIKEGEGATAALERLVKSVSTVNTWWERLGFNLFELSLSGADAASKIADLYGGIDAFNQSVGAYYANFFSDSERLQQAIIEMDRAISALGVDTMPRTNAQFRALVEAAQAAGDDELVAGLIQLAAGFNEITSATAQLNGELDRSQFATMADYQYALARRTSGAAGDVRTDMEVLKDSVDFLTAEFIRLTTKVVDATETTAEETLNARLASGVAA